MKTTLKLRVIITSSLVVVISRRRPLQRDVERIFGDAFHPKIEDSARRCDVGTRRKTLSDEDGGSDGLAVKRRGRDRFPEPELAAATLGRFGFGVVDPKRICKTINI